MISHLSMKHLAPLILAGFILSACTTGPIPKSEARTDPTASRDAGTSVEIAAAPDYYKRCTIADARTAGEVTLTIEPLSVGKMQKWPPNFGVILEDKNDEPVYKVASWTASDSLKPVGAEQLYFFSANPYEGASNQIEAFSPRPDGRVRMHLKWNRSGQVRVWLNDVDLGRVGLSRPYKNWELFVTGMAIRVLSTDADFADCKG